MIITRLIKYIVAVVGNTEKGIINVDYKVIIEVNLYRICNLTKR